MYIKNNKLCNDGYVNIKMIKEWHASDLINNIFCSIKYIYCVMIKLVCWKMNIIVILLEMEIWYDVHSYIKHLLDTVYLM